MAVIAVNATEHTKELLGKIIETDDFVKFNLQNRMDLNCDTYLIRLAIINLLTNELPSHENIARFKAALRSPIEFDEFLKDFTTNEFPSDYNTCPECGGKQFGVNQGILVCAACGHPSRIDELWAAQKKPVPMGDIFEK